MNALFARSWLDLCLYQEVDLAIVNFCPFFDLLHTFTYRMKHFLGMEFLSYLWSLHVDVDGHIMQRNWKGVWLWLKEGKIIFY